MTKGTRSTSQRTRINEQIRVPQVMVIGATGDQLGVMASREALTRAREQGLDLVEVSPHTKPPVCKILDYGKYSYNLNKKEKESRKKQKTTGVKEIKMSSKIGEHDYQTKLRNALRFIERGDKVKFTMFFRGREITHTDIGEKIIKRFTEDMSDTAEIERNAGLEGRTIQIYFSPLSAAKRKALAKKAAEKEEDKNAKVENE